MRAIHSVLALVCVIGLALVGVGWVVAHRPQSPAPVRVYCNIEKLMSMHPALRYADSSKESAESYSAHDVHIETVRVADVPYTLGQESESDRRQRLQASLLNKARRELEETNEQLCESLNRQLQERAGELESEATIVEAEARRLLESEMATGLRAIAERHQDQLTDAALKLAAARSQVAVFGGGEIPASVALKSREDSFAEAKKALLADEAKLKYELDQRVLAAGRERRDANERELNNLRANESDRIGAIIAHNRDALELEINGSGMDEWFVPAPKPGSIAVFNGARVSRESSNCSTGRTVASCTAVDSARIRAELESIVRRIARESQLAVVFDRSGNLPDKTDWFGDRLPYARQSIFGERL